MEMTIKNNDKVKEEITLYIEKRILRNTLDVISYVIGRLGYLDKELYLWIFELDLEGA